MNNVIQRTHKPLSFFVNKIKKTTIILTFIVLIGAYLRFHDLGVVPVSLYWDETAIGYNAYSIAKTGKDEYGARYPLLFRSYDDYKLPGYIYLTAGVLQVIPLNEFSVRFVSALLGTITILGIYLFVCVLYESFNGKRAVKESVVDNKYRTVGLLASFFLAISPWHIQFSRAAFEANGALFCVVFGTFFFLKGLKKAPKYYVSLILFAFSFYFYRSTFIFVPMLIVILLLLYGKLIYINKKLTYISLAFVLFVFLIAPVVYMTVFGEGTTRANQVSVITNANEEVYESAQKQEESGNTFISKILYNRRVVYGKIIITNYLSHFSPSFLFIEGDGNSRHGVKGLGLLYLYQLPFLLLGIGYCLYRHGRNEILILSWLLLAPIAASLSVPAPHALRSLVMVPVFCLLSAIGVSIIYSYIKQKTIFIVLLSVICILSLSYYLSLYYFTYPNSSANEWGDGYKQLVSHVVTREKDYERIIITGHYWQPYIYFLFYKQYNPSSLQTDGSAISFDKYYFGGTAWDTNKKREELGTEDLHEISENKKALVVLSPEEYQFQKNNLINTSILKNKSGKLMFIVGDLKMKH